MSPTTNDYLLALKDSKEFEPGDTKNRILRRAAFYIKLGFGYRTVVEKEPLDVHRAQHFGMAAGTRRSYKADVWTRKDAARTLRVLRKLYKDQDI